MPESPTPSHGPTLAGETVVFTGKLSSLGRREAQALVERLGGTPADEVTARTTLLVIGAAGFPAVPPRLEQVDDPDKSSKLKKAEQLNAKGAARIRVISEDEFCAVAGVPSHEALRQQYYSLRDVLGMYPSVREDHIRYLRKWGLIEPAARTRADLYLRFSDLLVIRQAAAELEQGASFRSVLRSLQASQEGQLAFNFRLAAAPARIIELRREAEPARGAGPEQARGTRLVAPHPTEAEQYFLEASLLDDGDEAKRDRAAAAYRRALEADPCLVAALINLANIHYAHDELAEAQALYERAIGLEPDFFEAHFNLGNIYHDLGRYGEGAACYQNALALNSDYADAHFYLAVTLEKMGASQEAKPHWRAYQRLAPQGEWVELAREFSDN